MCGQTGRQRDAFSHSDESTESFKYKLRTGDYDCHNVAVNDGACENDIRHL